LTDESFDPYIRLCNSKIAMFKIDSHRIDHEAEPGPIGTSFWVKVKHIIDYTLKSPNMTPVLQKKLLDDFDAAAVKKSEVKEPLGASFLQRWSRQWAETWATRWEMLNPETRGIKVTVSHLCMTHWAATRPPHWSLAGSAVMNTSFLHLAVQCQLLEYVKLSTLPSALDQLTFNQLLLAALLYHRLDCISQTSVYGAPSDYEMDPELDLEIVDYLLEKGADPNAQILESLLDKHLRAQFSPWEAAILTMRDGRKNQMPIMKTMLNHGADPRALFKIRSLYKISIPHEIERLAKRKKRESRIIVSKIFSKFR
jgi:regulator of RNase E activity RraB